MKKVRLWLARRLRFAADRIDHAGAPKRCSQLSFTFERGRGLVVHDRHGGSGPQIGCPLWYYGDADYQRAHAESIDPTTWVDWSTGRVIRP